MYKTIVVNLLAGPGAGKSIFCAEIFAMLKRNGINCEMAREYAKDLVWEESNNALNNQLYVFGHQQHRLYVLDGKVDVIITDSSLFNSIIYDAKKNINLQQVIIDEFNKFYNINYFLERVAPYEPYGRLQNEQEAIELDNEIKSKLNEFGIEYQKIKAYEENSFVIGRRIIEILKTRNQNN